MSNKITVALFLIVAVSVTFLVGILAYNQKDTDSTTTPQPNTKEDIVVPVSPQCGEEAKTISMGRPGVGSGVVAYFTTEGGDLYITAKGFEKGGFFDPEVGKTLVYIGKLNKLPIVDLQRATVGNTLVQLTVTENEYTKQAIDKGRYWVLTSNTVEIQITSCGDISKS